MGSLPSKVRAWRPIKSNRFRDTLQHLDSYKVFKLLRVAFIPTVLLYLTYLLLSQFCRIIPSVTISNSSSPSSWRTITITAPSSHATEVFVTPPSEDDLLYHTPAAQRCNISLGDMYLVPISKEPPFCKNRQALLKSLNSGKHIELSSDRYRPYLGEDCMYRWFPSFVVCHILERFQSLTFIGNVKNSASSVTYTALNMLLREDLISGGLLIDEKDEAECRCGKQLSNEDCIPYRITESSQLKNENANYCNQISHLFISTTTKSNTPQNPEEILRFKAQTYNRPNPWQPSPVILSLSPTSDSESDIEEELIQWLQLASDAERNIPFLLLGPMYNNHSSRGEERVEKMKRLAERHKESNVEFLNLWGLKAREGKGESKDYGLEVALIQAMMVVNWLAMLETS